METPPKNKNAAGKKTDPPQQKGIDKPSNK
jgi:hypothetical protein